MLAQVPQPRRVESDPLDAVGGPAAELPAVRGHQPRPADDLARPDLLDRLDRGELSDEDQELLARVASNEIQAD